MLFELYTKPHTFSIHGSFLLSSNLTVIVNLGNLNTDILATLALLKLVNNNYTLLLLKDDDYNSNTVINSNKLHLTNRTVNGCGLYKDDDNNAIYINNNTDEYIQDKSQERASVFNIISTVLLDHFKQINSENIIKFICNNNKQITIDVLEEVFSIIEQRYLKYSRHLFVEKLVTDIDKFVRLVIDEYYIFITELIKGSKSNLM